MKPIFCGNLEYEVRQSDLERLFGRYGNVDRVDIKTGFAFVYMDDERDAKDAISGLDRKEFGRQGRRLRVEWTKEERGMRRPSGRPGHFSGNLKPTKTLFVINFDPISTRTRDLERHFEPYGKISNIRIRRNFAFIQYESLDDANKALEATNMSKILDRVISVEYAVRDDNERRDVHSPDQRDRGRPRERKHDYDRSSSPYRRAERASPDYGHSSRSPRRSDPQGSPDQRVRDRSPPKRQNWDNGRSPSPIKNVQDRSLEMRRKASGRRSPNFYERADPNGDPNLSPYGRKPQQDSSPYDESPISER